MKKTFALLLFSTLLFIRCTNVNHKVVTTLTEDQRNFLSVPSLNRVLTFNENGWLYDLQVDSLHIDEQFEDEDKAGLLTTPGYQYYSEKGYVYYRLANGNAKIRLSAHSSLSYGNGYQYVTIMKNTPDGRTDLVFPLDFKRVSPHRTIEGRDYKNVVVATTANKDSLFWKRDMGVLGWKEHGTGRTTYQDFE